MIELFGLVMRLAGEVHAELFENAGIDLREHDGGMDLAAGKLGKLRERKLCHRVGRRRDGQRDQHLVGVQTRVVVAETFNLELLDRLDDELRQNVQVVRQTGERFERGEQGCGRGAEQGSGLAGDDGAVG